jgi:hypothetical protein
VAYLLTKNGVALPGKPLDPSTAPSLELHPQRP